EMGENGDAEKIFVSVRLRPLNGREIVTNDVSDWECFDNNTIVYNNGNVYQDGAKDVVLSVVGGINASIFAYGQTSSGKTFTMTGITEYTLADIYDYVQKTIESSPNNYLGRDSASTLVSTVNFVDLAGSERASQSLTAGTRLKEGCHINRSLLTLGTVIRKLSKGRSGHIPFRDSKLTRILQSSLGGNSRTAIICTMSPARSHVEQSRNTLLFASCAKEVSTNAQVNTVISDKALVKHLQRELDRLENELRTPSSNRLSPDTSTLLREKDNQIEKMLKQIEDLTAERDQARSQVQDLLRVVEDNEISLIRLGPDNYPQLRVQMISETENYMPETSIVVDPRQSFDGSVRTLGSSRYSPRRSESSFEENYIPVTEFEENSPTDSTPIRPMLRIAQSSETDSCHDWNDVEEKSNGSSHELCKVVRCIESEDATPKAYVQSYRSSPDTKIRISSETVSRDDHNGSPLEHMSPESCVDEELNEHNKVVPLPLKEAQEVETPLKEDESGNKPPLNEQLELNGSIEDDYVLVVPQSFKLPKSRSCNDGIHATLLNKLEHDSTPQNGGTPHSCTFNYGVELEKGTIDHNSEEPEKKTLIEEEPVEAQDDKQVDDNQITTTEETKTVKSIGLDPIVNSFRATSWRSEFKRLQKEIVQRLAFVKDMFSRVNAAVDDGQTITRSTTEKALRREREMLTKQMHKKLTEQEREGLFLRWEIGLNTKYRRIQLANKLWSQVDDIDHVADSAVVVAKLVGLISDPGHAPKEMFGLNLTPPNSKKSYSFKRSSACICEH
ncbi:hypothetical protein M8C21_014468, partial [Ambrosia artemisiifolia]